MRRYTTSNVVLILVGNKCDLEEEREVELSEAEAMSEFIPEILFAMETSAKDNTNIENMFMQIATELKVMTKWRKTNAQNNVKKNIYYFLQRRQSHLNDEDDVDRESITLTEGHPVNSCNSCKFLW